MPKIRLQKLILLTIFTVGIYSLVWLARRRDEIVKQYKAKIPHWTWLIVPSIAILALTFPVALIAYGGTMSAEGTAAIIIGFYLLACLAAYGISIWWMWGFGKYAANLTEGRVSRTWIMLLWIFTGVGVIFALQYYFNRTKKVKDIETEPKFKPSKKFIVLSSIAIAISLGLSVASFMLIPGEDLSTLTSEGREIDKKFEESERLFKSYNECLAQLEADYPGELTLENEDAYRADYDACERIRVKQNAAADAYNAAVEAW